MEEVRETNTSAVITPFVSDETRKVVEFVSYVVLCGPISVFGMVANVISVAVFFRMGSSSAINISFIALAVSDFFSLLTTLCNSILYNPLILYSKTIPFDPLALVYLIGGWVHGTCVRLVAMLTALITCQRCICVLFPFKVKELGLLKPRRFQFALGSVVVLTMVPASTVFYANRFVWMFVAGENRTILTLSYSENKQELEFFLVNYGNVLFYTSIAVIIVCTTFLCILLRKNSKKRTTMTSTTVHAEQQTLKDKRVSRVVGLLFIGVMFIACYLPSALVSFSMSAIEGFSIFGVYSNSFTINWALACVLEAINSSLNIVIYYQMSGKFKAVFTQTFRRWIIGPLAPPFDVSADHEY